MKPHASQSQSPSLRFESLYVYAVPSLRRCSPAPAGAGVPHCLHSEREAKLEKPQPGHSQSPGLLLKRAFLSPPPARGLGLGVWHCMHTARDAKLLKPQPGHSQSPSRTSCLESS